MLDEKMLTKEQLNEIGPRFWKRVEKTPTCWLWTGYKMPKGYGQIRVDGSGGSALLVHRVSFMLVWGHLADTECVLHRCDNPPCVRPDHLFRGTHADNGRDMVQKGRSSRGTHRPNSKLTENDVLEIRNDPRSQRTIAYDYGVSQMLINRVKRRLIWRHV